MVLIFNSLSSPEMKKQQYMYYLWQAQKKIMQWLHPSFPEGSVIVQDKEQSPHPHPRPMWRRQGTPAEIFAKMMCFLKQEKKKKGHLILAYIKLFLLHKASGWGMTSRWRTPHTALGFPRYGDQSTPRLPRPACHNQPPPRLRVSRAGPGNPMWLQTPEGLGCPRP